MRSTVVGYEAAPEIDNGLLLAGRNGQDGQKEKRIQSENSFFFQVIISSHAGFLGSGPPFFTQFVQ